MYRPQSNGRAERAVQSLVNALRLYLVFRKLDWIYALPFALWGLNDLPAPIAPKSPDWLDFRRDLIRFGGVGPPDGGYLGGGCDRVLPQGPERTPAHSNKVG